MTNLPKHILRQVAEAEALEAQLARSAEQAPPVAQSVDALLAAQPEEVAQIPETPPAAPAPASVAQPDNFEHKYRVLQGMYEADVRRVKDAQRALDERLRSLEQTPPPPAQPPESSAKDIETFGADLVDMVKRYVEGQQAQVEQRLVALEQRIGVVAQQTQGTTKRTFFQELQRLVPNFEDINTDERWLVWLGEVDPLFGTTRQKALDEAQAQADAKRVAGFFHAFERSLPPPPAPDPGLAQQVTPATSGNPPPRPAPAKPNITHRAIESFYRDVAQGKYAGRQAEMDALELQINLAVAEGRVVN